MSAIIQIRNIGEFNRLVKHFASNFDAAYKANIVAQALHFKNSAAVKVRLQQKQWINIRLTDFNTRLAGIDKNYHLNESHECAISLSVKATTPHSGGDAMITLTDIIKSNLSAYNHIPQPSHTNPESGSPVYFWDKRAIIDAAEKALHKLIHNAPDLSLVTLSKCDNPGEPSLTINGIYSGSPSLKLAFLDVQDEEADVSLSRLLINDEVAGNVDYAMRTIVDTLLPFIGVFGFQSTLYDTWPVKPEPITTTPSGMYFHSSYPVGMSEDTPIQVIETWLDRHQSRLTGVFMENQVSDDIWQDWCDEKLDDYTFWKPKIELLNAVLLYVIDTEDGPFATFITPR
jgi:hypothetical protein